MIVTDRPRPSSLRIKQKLAALRTARVLKRGGLIAHHTATVAGVAANPGSSSAVSKLKLFKQRRGPFLMLAESLSTALGYARYLTPSLRKLARESWPGPVTLLFPARPGLPSSCYQKGMMAVRVDGDPNTRLLARACGGLLLSSSLNRKGGKGHNPCYAVQMRWQRFLSARSALGNSSGRASSIFRVDHRGVRRLR